MLTGTMIGRQAQSGTRVAGAPPPRESRTEKVYFCAWGFPVPNSTFESKKKKKKNLLYRSRVSPGRALYSQPPTTHILPREIPEAHFMGWKVKARCRSAPGAQRHPTDEDPRVLTFGDST